MYELSHVDAWHGSSTQAGRPARRLMASDRAPKNPPNPPEEGTFSDLGTLAEIYTIVISVDTSLAEDNVSVDLGLLPPTLAFHAVQQVFEALGERLWEQRATVIFRSQTLEPVPADSDDD
jgi:hypothetical protein